MAACPVSGLTATIPPLPRFLPRRAIGSLIAVVTLGSSVESAASLVRDGAMHHETAAAAAAHLDAGTRGHHGHEDGGPQSRPHSHNSQHQHGTTADHCTHMHGVGLVAPVQWSVAGPVVQLLTEQSSSHSHRLPLPDVPPPRA